MIGLRWIGLAMLPVLALAACDDDEPAVSTHAALHSLADEACKEIEVAPEGERAAVIARAVARGDDEVGASSDEVMEILAEECPELLPPGE
jgi:hypothetical protein